MYVKGAASNNIEKVDYFFIPFFLLKIVALFILEKEKHLFLFIKVFLNSIFSENKLVSWLSAVAPAAFDLKVRMEYFELTRETNKTMMESRITSILTQ